MRVCSCCVLGMPRGGQWRLLASYLRVFCCSVQGRAGGTSRSPHGRTGRQAAGRRSCAGPARSTYGIDPSRGPDRLSASDVEFVPDPELEQCRRQGDRQPIPDRRRRQLLQACLSQAGLCRWSGARHRGDHRERVGCGSGCEIRETAGINFTEAEMARRAETGMSFKVLGRRASLVMTIPNAYFAAVLQAHRKVRGAAILLQAAQHSHATPAGNPPRAPQASSSA